MDSMEFYRGKRVFLTGHTGFKGAWMSRVLVNAGAVLTGYALQPPTMPNLFELAGLAGRSGLAGPAFAATSAFARRTTATGIPII